MATETTTRIATTLYDARRAMRTLLGPKFDGHVSVMKPVLQRFAVHIGTDNMLEAAAQLALRLDPSDTTEKLMILATAVELLEPSTNDGDKTFGLPHMDSCQLKYGGSRCTCGLLADTQGQQVSVVVPDLAGK